VLGGGNDQQGCEFRILINEFRTLIFFNIQCSLFNIRYSFKYIQRLCPCICAGIFDHDPAWGNAAEDQFVFHSVDRAVPVACIPRERDDDL